MKKVILLFLVTSLCMGIFTLSSTVSAAQSNMTFSFAPTDVVSNEDGSMLYLSDKAGKKVYSIDTGTFEQKSISFSLMPESLYYKDGKLYVSLCEQAHSYYWWTENQKGAYAIVDCTTFTKTAQYNIGIDPYDIVVSNDDTVFISSGSGQWTEILGYDGNGGVVATQQIRNMSTIEYDSVLDRIYSITSDSSPRNMSAYPINRDGTFGTSYGWPYHGDYAMGTTFFIAPDGAHILNSSGNVFVCQADKAGDMKFKISLNKSWTALAFGAGGKSFYTALSNKQIYAYDYATFEGTATYEAQGYPQYLFTKGDTLVAVSKETADGSVYFIESVDLSAPKTTIQITVTSGPLLYANGHARLGVKSNAKTVFNGDRMYIADNLENAVFAIDTTALTETKITFPDTPNSLYYQNGELFVGFGERGVVVILDAQTFEVKEKLLLGTVFYDVAVGKDGFIYIIENFGSSAFSYARSFSRATGQQVSSASVYPRNGKFVPHPVSNMFYWADTGVSPQDVNALSYSGGVITAAYDSPYHGTYPIGSRVKISPDGAYLFTSSGSVFKSSAVKANDMLYKGKFLSFADLAFDLSENYIFASGVGANLSVYDYDTYEKLGFLKTVFPVKEMALNGTDILALSVEKNNLFCLERLDSTAILQVVPEEIIVHTKDVIFLRGGEYADLAPTLLYNDGTSKSVTDTAAYRSSDEAIATVSPSGRVLAKNSGHAEITIESEGIEKEINVYVDFDVTSITVEGYDIAFSPSRTAYYVMLPYGTVAAPQVTYDAPAGVVVNVTPAAEIPGTTTVTVTDATGTFHKTYIIYFFTDAEPPVPGGEMPFIIGGYYGASNGFIYLDLRVYDNPDYHGAVPGEYTLVIQLFTKELEPVSLSATANVRQTLFSFSDQYIVIIAIVDQFGQQAYIGVPLAKPLLFMM